VRSFGVILGVVLAVAACGPKGPSKATPKGEVSGLPVGPPLATPGEKMSYRLTLKGVELGTYLFAVGDVVDLNGAKTVVVQAQAKSGGLASLVADIDDRFTSWVDIKTGRPRRFEVFEHADRKSKDIDHIVIDFGKRDGNVIPVQYAVNDETEMKVVNQPVTFPEVWDYNAFLLAVRSWEADKGSTAKLEVFRSRYIWRVTITRGGKGTLVTELGELPVVRFDAVTTKIDRNGQRYAGQEDRNFTLWISDDDGRVPLKLDATSDFGSISMAIVAYEPGTGARLRQ
jgi:hypothetical protein